MIKGEINLYIELHKHKLDQVVQQKHKNFTRQAYKVKLRRLWRKTYEGKYDTRDKNLPTVLANSSYHSRARRHNTECK